MLNIINGIIVDTFQEQREQQNERNDAQLNKCYICNVERQTVEKEGDNFTYHNEVKHSYINYFQYLLSIRKTNAQDLNSLDFSISDKIDKERTDFFPKSKDYVPGEK
jgi:inositol 1,4,5-triphosphate receptor type 1/inositol 1,4,5-triphosphate receptor type 3